MAWVAGLAVVLVVLHACGRVLPTPPVPWPLATVDGWLQSHGPILAAFALLRVGALVVAWYLVAVTGLTAVARIVASRSLATVALRLTPRVARAAVRSLLGAGLTVTVLTTAAPVLAHASAAPPTTSSASATSATSDRPGSALGQHVVRTDVGSPGRLPDGSPEAPPATRPPATIVVTPLDPAAQGPTSPVPSDAPSTTAPPTDSPTPADQAAPTTATPSTGSPPSTPAPPEPGPVGPPQVEAGAGRSIDHGIDSAPDGVAATRGPVTTNDPNDRIDPAPASATTWRIAPGDHLWHVAEATLRTAWGRAPTDVEIVPYWRAVIAANRDRLVDPANPDLVVPGQELLVPVPPPSPP